VGRPVNHPPRHPDRPARARAFTLAELIVATTVTVLLAGSTAGILRGVVDARTRADRQDALQAEARAAVEAIALALGNAHRVGGEQAVLEGTDGWRGDLPDDRIRFFTVTTEGVRPGLPESDVVECEFRLSRPDGKDRRKQWHQRTTGGGPVLLRRLDPTRNPAPDQGGVVELIARDVAVLDFAYHDGIEWRPKWSAKDKGWPLAVRISLAVVGKDRRTKVWTTSRIVNFPLRPGVEEKKDAP